MAGTRYFLLSLPRPDCIRPRRVAGGCGVFVGARIAEASDRRESPNYSPPHKSAVQVGRCGASGKRGRRTERDQRRDCAEPSSRSARARAHQANAIAVQETGGSVTVMLPSSIFTVVFALRPTRS